MIAASKLDLANLLYLAGAVLAAAIICTALALRHRRPKTIEADMESFSRGLRALAPEADGPRRRSAPARSSDRIPDLRAAPDPRSAPRRPPGAPGRPAVGGHHDETGARSG